MKNIAKFFGISIVATLLISGMGGVSACHEFSDLYAGQHTIVGEVEVLHAGGSSTVTITYRTDDGWEIKNTHLGVVKDFDDFPTTKKGNPKVGHLGREGLDGCRRPTTKTDTMVEYEVDIGAGYTGPLYIAAHAVVWHPCLGEETAWGNTGTSFPGNNWALYFVVEIV